MIFDGGVDPVSAWRSDMAELHKQSSISVRALAAKTGYSRTYCHQAIKGPTVPPWEVCKAVLISLGAEPADWTSRWRAARQAQNQPTEIYVGPVELSATCTDAQTGEDFDAVEGEDIGVEAPAGAVIHNRNHVSVVVNTPAGGDSPPASSSPSTSGRLIRIFGPTTTRWTVRTGAAVALVAATVVANSGGGQPAPTPAAASAPAVTIIQVPPTPTTSITLAPATRTSADNGKIAGNTTEPITVPASASQTAAPPAVIPPASNGAQTDPAANVPGGHCKQVIGEDVRVFANPQDTQQTWATWTRGTLFWAIVGRGTSDRYATSLRNGQAAWITKDSRYVIDASGCP